MDAQVVKNIIHKYTTDDKKNLQKMGELAQYVDNDEKEEVIFESDIKDEMETLIIDDNFIANI
jgi:hypothetical protein